jgi:hypothetical protein
MTFILFSYRSSQPWSTYVGILLFFNPCSERKKYLTNKVNFFLLNVVSAILLYMQIHFTCICAHGLYVVAQNASRHTELVSNPSFFNLFYFRYITTLKERKTRNDTYFFRILYSVENLYLLISLFYFTKKKHTHT